MPTPNQGRNPTVSEAGRKGGQVTSADEKHMSDIGRKGGITTSSDEKHMSDIGRHGRATPPAEGWNNRELGDNPTVREAGAAGRATPPRTIEEEVRGQRNKRSNRS